ncbi:MAG: S8 family serine peptidase [Anaerolineales bacterium]
MKRVLSLFCLCVLLFCASSTLGRSYPVNAMDDSILGNVDVLIQTDGSTQPVINQITSVGGTINYVYQNVSALAATIPAEALGSVHNHPDVIRVAKDSMIILLDGTAPEGRTRPEDLQVLDAAGFVINSIDPNSLKPNISPQGYGSYLNSGADQIWMETQRGSGSVVAVVDTGTVPNVCLRHAVIGAPGFPEGYNATGDGIPATDPRNHWHGTHIGGVIASACTLDFSNNPSDPLNQAISTYLPWGKNEAPIFGQAPAAQIYPVKIFDTGGGNSPTSVILDGLDHLLTLKRTNALDIDVVNLSFGGPTGFEGRAILDTFLEQFRVEGMLVIAAAGNSGPLPNSLASPATSSDSIAVGALDYADTSRVFYEYLGLVDLQTPDQGLVMRPSEEIRVADFSSRGPMSDGRFGPDLTAPGMWSFQFGSQDDLHWAFGTSYAAAVVSGTAALLNAHYETETGLDTPWLAWRNSLLLGADREIIGEDWQDLNTAGYGALDAAAALQILKSGNTHLKSPDKSANLRSNILANPMSADNQVFESGSVALNPSQSYDTVIDISDLTSKVTIQVYDISAPDNSAYAYWPNSLKILVQSAKRSAFSAPINAYWDPNFSGSEFTIEIDDGNWIFAGNPVASQPMEPGLMKVSLVGDYANESRITFNLRVIREQAHQPDTDKPFAKSIIKMGDVINLPVEIPAGVSEATFDLVWNRDWLKFPTSDMDMLVFDPDQNLVSLEGATWNAPERAVISDPAPGVWRVQIEAREIYKTDLFRLYLKTESNQENDPQSSDFDIITKHPATDFIPGTGDDTAIPYIIWLPIVP